MNQWISNLREETPQKNVLFDKTKSNMGLLNETFTYEPNTAFYSKL